MRVVIAAVGKMKAGPQREMAASYLERAAAMGRGLGLEGFSVSEHPESRAGSVGARRAEEARALAGGEGVLVALDERGRGLDSEAFARRIGDWRDSGRPALRLVIGGADGLDPALIARADLVLSLSAMTWPHQLVRIMLAEQLYRAATILAGHPYHRG